MISISDRLASLGAKYRGATRTAKDGQEYSQLIFEAEAVELADTEVNSIFSNPNAYAAIKQLHAAVKGVKAIELDEKIEGAQFYVRLGAVNAANGPEYTFNDCVVDHLRLERLESEAIMGSFRVTTKPALDGKFGELISRMGHTVVLRLNAIAPSAQAALPLDAGGGDPNFTDAELPGQGTKVEPIGTPEEEREKARLREVAIAKELTNGRVHPADADAAIGDGKTTAELLASKPKRRGKNAHAAH